MFSIRIKTSQNAWKSNSSGRVTEPARLGRVDYGHHARDDDGIAVVQSMRLHGFENQTQAVQGGRRGCEEMHTAGEPVPELVGLVVGGGRAHDDGPLRALGVGRRGEGFEVEVP
mmetsp:Transcript_21295/g.29296  ORF Transcript_21295/g.29296 Transcript_21295/m.29296 type:complete len:114 (+) Transcript_21295:134-475(+)